jgi:hypothetical protein
MSIDFFACLIAVTTGGRPASGWTMSFIYRAATASCSPALRFTGQ